MAGFNFGTPTSTAAPSFTLGNNPSTAGTTGFNFAAPSSGPTTTAPQFNTQTSTPGTSTFGASGGSGFSFGATGGGLSMGTPSTQAKPGGLTFGSPSTSTGLTFGSTTSAAQPSLTFGSTAATTTAATGLSFTPATTSQPLNFGTTPATITQPTAATTASTGFSLGTPATTASLSFGLGGQTPKPTLTFGATTTASTSTPLLNFSTPKTTASTGFSLTVSGAGTGTGSLFPTSSAPTTTATVAFKGLGGVDTTTTQGSGQKDAKSVKENVVNPEIMQTLDVFKNFVKQQKNLSCEVSRAPVKPMHKVTEDTDALNKLLTSVSSTLQKNRVIANKLKADTTKCLSLCEMAQRTHDTPPGLQNDNVAPLEFFIQLVSKFERDIQVLRQEIDNTEKHVNSLSFPAILTPQELSIALRRLHDSFVALAGRLQTAHAGVIAQKERHLSLRRHFLKDTTNIFDSSTTTTAKKPLCKSVLAMPGPTPFSSLGGMNMTTLMTGPEKPVTFATGTPSLSVWGSPMTSGNTTFMQSPGTSALGTSQTSDAQNFQLGRPPPGNKRGKR